MGFRSYMLGFFWVEADDGRRFGVTAESPEDATELLRAEGHVIDPAASIRTINGSELEASGMVRSIEDVMHRGVWFSETPSVDPPV